MSVSGEEHLRTLVEEAIRRTARRGEPIEALRGVALYDTGRDEKVTSLSAFETAVEAIGADPLVRERYGSEASRRLAIQFVYEVAARSVEPAFNTATFENVWEAFSDELSDPDWLYRGLANMRNFTSDETFIGLPDGVTIRGRSFDELSGLGFDEYVLRQLAEDWMGPGASSYVIVVEHRIEKRPDNFTLMDSGTLWTKAWRALGALRLLNSGDISFGRMWFARPTRFNVGLGGVSSTGVLPGAIGSLYQYSASMASAVADLYADLRQLEQQGYGAAPGNLDLALRSFMATYDRQPLRQDTRLVDAITALEAVLGTETEIAFKLAFRVAALLASDDQERASLFHAVKDFYDTRSRILHGSRLKEKHQSLLNNVDDLRDMVRRLLRGFIHLALSEGHDHNRQFFQESLDSALLQSEERTHLRAAMGLR